MKSMITYEFSTDANDRKAYYRIREECYKEVWGLTVFSGQEDQHDRDGHVLIARKGKQVIGGGRLVLRNTKSSRYLPMETDDFRLHEVLPDLGSSESVWGEIGRIAVIPKHRGDKVLLIGLYLLSLAQEKGCNYLTTVAPTRQAQKYKRIATPANIDIQIIDFVPVADHPYYNNIEMKLLLCDIATAPDAKRMINAIHTKKAEIN